MVKTLTDTAKSYIADQIVAFFTTPQIRLYDSAGNLIKTLDASVTKETIEGGYRVKITARDSSADEYTVYSFDVYDADRAEVFATISLDTPVSKSSTEYLDVEYDLDIVS